jgi:hypothetical protein
MVQKESNTGVIETPDDEPPLVEAMINFMYKFDFTSPTEFSDAILFQAKVVHPCR